MSDPTGTFDRLGLTEYESTALSELFALGRTTAPTLAEATDVPKARIYGVLDSLAERGFLEVIPGRPKQYQPRAPERVLDRAIENRKHDFERFSRDLEADREAFLSEFSPRYERARSDEHPTEELFHVVDVGTASEAETRQLYEDATEQLVVITTSFEYFGAIESAFSAALERGVEITVLLLHPALIPADDRSQAEKATIQAEITDRIETEYPGVEVCYSTGRLPWRGTLADPSMAYDSGRAIVLVEENDVPDSMRQAALTENGSFVAGLLRYFDLIKEHESVVDPTEADGLSTD